MTTPPLSHAAQAIMVAATNGNFNVVNDPVYKQCIAAAIRALVSATLPEEEPFRGGMRPGGTQPVVMEEFRQAQRRHTRAKQLAIAAELDGGEPQPTPTENHDD